ncbi:MAG: 23S rRNA (guanosine(2251)-2'-O)-methyltransferase RlmB [Flavobacteriaceae bacterium]
MEQTKIFGIRAVIEAINSGVSVDKVFIQKGIKGPLMQELNQLIKDNNISISLVPIEKLDRLSKNNNHQGAVAQIAAVPFFDFDEILNEESPMENRKFLLLDGVSDVRNFGAIIRTAECTGVRAIVIAKSGSAPLNAETIKTSAGAAFKVPICKVDHIKDAVFMLQASEITTVAATEKTDTTLYDVDFCQDIAIIMGSEHKGVNPSILKIVDYKAKLPMLGSISSLNVSVACGAFLYEAIRQTTL